LLDVEEISRRDMIDLALFCNLCYLLFWLLEGQATSTRAPPLDALLTGTIDFFYAWGVNHMLTKREKLLDTIYFYGAKPPWWTSEVARL
jgi:hypothetical protein